MNQVNCQDVRVVARSYVNVNVNVYTRVYQCIGCIHCTAQSYISAFVRATADGADALTLTARCCWLTGCCFHTCILIPCRTRSLARARDARSYVIRTESTLSNGSDCVSEQCVSHACRIANISSKSDIVRSNFSIHFLPSVSPFFRLPSALSLLCLYIHYVAGKQP